MDAIIPWILYIETILMTVLPDSYQNQITTQRSGRDLGRRSDGMSKR